MNVFVAPHPYPLPTRGRGSAARSRHAPPPPSWGRMGGGIRPLCLKALLVPSALDRNFQAQDQVEVALIDVKFLANRGKRCIGFETCPSQLNGKVVVEEVGLGVAEISHADRMAVAPEVQQCTAIGTITDERLSMIEPYFFQIDSSIKCDSRASRPCDRESCHA